MCELFAANAKRPQTLNAPLTTFFGNSVMHPHGWGLAVRDAQGAIDLHKGPERAIDAPECRRALATPVNATHVLAHIRYATKGRISPDNCHPFIGHDVTGAEWAFIHNGSIFHPEAIERFMGQAKGQSDSERVLLYLMDALDAAARRGVRDFDGRLSVLADALGTLAPGNKVNVILDDGEFTYVYTDTADDTLYCKQGDQSALFCTEPLDAEGWQAVPKCRLLAYRDGSPVAASERRGELYHLDMEELTAFLLANAA